MASKGTEPTQGQWPLVQTRLRSLSLSLHLCCKGGGSCSLLPSATQTLSRAKAHGLPGHSCGTQPPREPGSPLGTGTIPGSRGRVRRTGGGVGGGARTGQGRKGRDSSFCRARLPQQEAEDTTAGGRVITVHWAAVLQGGTCTSVSPPAQQTSHICRQQARTKLLSPQILVLRRKSVPAISF